MLAELKAANIEVLEQLLAFLKSLPDAVYETSHEVDGVGALGRHVRHVLDAYRALIAAQESGLVDYDSRHRDSPAEWDLALARQELGVVIAWVHSLDTATDGPIRLKSEVSVSQTRPVVLATTPLRELCHVASHTTHHLAMIALLAARHGLAIDAGVGLAPATASYLRSLQRGSLED